MQIYYPFHLLFHGVYSLYAHVPVRSCTCIDIGPVYCNLADNLLFTEIIAVTYSNTTVTDV